MNLTEPSATKTSFLYCFLGGFLFALGFPNIISPVLIPAPIIAIYILINRNTFFREGRVRYSFRRDFASLLCFSFSAYLMGYNWLPYTLSEFGNIPAPFNYLVSLLFCFIIFPQYLVFLFILRIIKKFRTKLPFTKPNHPYFNLFFASLLTLLEYFVPQLFDTHAGHAWLSLSPYIGLAPIFGKVIFSFIVYYFVFFILKLKNEEKFEYLPISTFIIFILTNFFLKLEMPEKTKETEILKVRVVQGNIGNYIKLESENGNIKTVSDVLMRYQELSFKGESKIDFLVWPETAYPNLFPSKNFSAQGESLPDFFNTILDRLQADLFFGGYDIAETQSGQKNFESDYNAGFLLRHNSEQNKLSNWYHKMKLIPFGESLPFGRFNNYLSNYITNISYFKSGERYVLFETKKGATFVASICYEILNPDFTRNYINTVNELTQKHPHFIVNLTNDSWYGDSIEPHQHLYLSHWRSVELNLPIIRSTNTGFTTVLYPDGSQDTRSALFQPETLDYEIALNQTEPTIYQRYGLLPLGLVILLLGIIIGIKIVILQRTKSRKI
jgi:apolipoprotein N-acyltransferase